MYSNSAGLAYQNATANLIVFSVGGSTIGAGFSVAPYNIGATTTGLTVTPNPTNGNYQYMSANSTWTLAAPSSDCAIDILVTNGTGASTISFSGFKTPGAGASGATYATTSGAFWVLSIRRLNSVSTYTWNGPWTT
jgi:hypothetical protein